MKNVSIKNENKNDAKNNRLNKLVFMKRILWQNDYAKSNKSVRAYLSFVRRFSLQSPLRHHEKPKLINYAQKLNLHTGTLTSIYNTLKIQYNVNCGKVTPEQRQIINRKFENIISREVSEEQLIHDFKQFLISFKTPMQQIIRILQKDQTNMPSFIQSIVQEINDIYVKNEDIKRKRAQAFEESLETFLQAQHVDFHTEREIIDQQLHKLTPDILFKEPIEIQVNDEIHIIHWMDAKNYFLINVPFIMNNLQTQSKKYNDEFGAGAFVFHYGFDESIKIENTLILDASMFDHKN